MRSVVFALSGILSVAPLLAQEVAPEAGRFAISASEEGFVRLDTETGSMAHCDNRDGVWYCDPLGADPSAVDRQVFVLSEQVAELSRQIGRLAEDLDALQSRVDVPVEPLAVQRTAEDELSRRGEALGFAEQVMQRLFDMVREIKLEEASRT
jgi:hypothetical protein